MINKVKHSCSTTPWMSLNQCATGRVGHAPIVYQGSFPVISALFLSEAVQERPRASSHSCQKPGRTKIEGAEPGLPLSEWEQFWEGGWDSVFILSWWPLGSPWPCLRPAGAETACVILPHTQWEDCTGIIVIVTYCKNHERVSFFSHNICSVGVGKVVCSSVDWKRLHAVGLAVRSCFVAVPSRPAP